MLLLPTLLLLASPAASQPPQLDPTPPVVVRQPLAAWSFDRGPDGWQAEAHCTLAAEDGRLAIQVTESDPYIHHAVQIPGGTLLLEVRARSRTTGPLEAFWTTDQSPRRDESKHVVVPLTHDGQWHDYQLRLAVRGTMTDLRIDPGDTVGQFEIASIRLLREEPFPLVIESIDTDDNGGRDVRFDVRNRLATPLEFVAQGVERSIATEGTAALRLPQHADLPLEQATLELSVKGFPPLRRTLFLYHDDAPASFTARPLGPYTLEIARDGTLGRVRRDGQTVAVLAPLVLCEGRGPALKLVADGDAPAGPFCRKGLEPRTDVAGAQSPARQAGPTVRLEGDGIAVSIAPAQGGELSIAIDSAKECEGPVVRAIGPLQQGLFAGLEYLDKGEASSSKLDVETDEHVRFAPDPLKVTLPLMSLVTDRASLAMTWDDMTLRPVFATPNFFDAASDHRMALRGRAIRATIQVGRLSLEDTILWAVKRHGLPALPLPPRNDEQQRQLSLKALSGPPLKTDEGWGHCVEPHWKRQPFTDIASAFWRLSGQVPELPKLVPGGAHVTNESIYFVSGRAAQWKEMAEGRVLVAIVRQRLDGSFRYRGPLARGHFEDTASGVCARPAAMLLDYARLTGNAAAQAAGLKALGYMKRFRVPRGAQVWEVPLHTPDQLASAYAVWANVRGYELTGDRQYLAEARRWALSGIPFVYLWGRYPVMLYGTPPVFGATNWRAPCWIGLPVQWVGGVYAYSLTMLAPYDQTLDWKKLARGILIAAEQMQFPDGPYAGLLPDSFELRGQERRPWRINPSAIESLRSVLDGRVDDFSVATAGGHRVAAPFPVSLHDGKAQIQGRAGLKYQILIDGRVVDVASQGEDLVPVP
jgi:hypothetical protein